jgi:hypothetical protein
LSVSEHALLPEEVAVFKVIWKCLAPSKVSEFLWKLLLDRIPTKVNLRRRRVIPADGNQACVFCDNNSESSLHLLLYCDFAITVWRDVFDWLGLRLQFPHNFTSLFNFALGVPGCKQTKRALVMIWGAVLWSLWQHRNQIAFDNVRPAAEAVIDKIKMYSWRWWVCRSNGNRVYCTRGYRSQLFVWRCV